MVEWIGGWLTLNVLVAAGFGVAAARSGKARGSATVWVPPLVAGLATACLIAALSSRASDWQPPALFGALLVLAVVGDLLSSQTGRFQVSVSFLCIVLAAALLGPAPAVAIGLTGTLADVAARRPGPLNALINLAAYAIWPLATGLVLRWTRGFESEIAFAAQMLLVIPVANLLNFVCVAAPTCRIRGERLAPAVRMLWAPLLPWQLAAASVVSATILAEDRWGPVAIALAAIAMTAFRPLLLAVLERDATSHELQRRDLALDMRIEQLAARHEGMLGVLLELETQRRPAALARAAAVARGAHALARAADLDPRDVAIAHTAGLLHELGADGTADPAHAARLIRRVPGLEAVAAVVDAHHERPDGGGPMGLTSEATPVVAQVLAVVVRWQAIVEAGDDGPAARARLRAGAGTTLDERLCEVWLTKVAPSGRFARASNPARELQIERESRPLLDGAYAVAPPIRSA
jgi:hypothetical protein